MILEHWSEIDAEIENWFRLCAGLQALENDEGNWISTKQDNQAKKQEKKHNWCKCIPYTVNMVFCDSFWRDHSQFHWNPSLCVGVTVSLKKELVRGKRIHGHQGQREREFKAHTHSTATAHRICGRATRTGGVWEQQQRWVLEEDPLCWHQGFRTWHICWNENGKTVEAMARGSKLHLLPLLYLYMLMMNYRNTWE